MTEAQNITEQLFRLHIGDEAAISQLLPEIRTELRRIARSQFGREGAAHSIDPSDLVQDASLHLLRPGVGPWKSREHFFAIAAITIRRRLVERARARRAKKRGGTDLKRVLLEEATSIDYEDAGAFLDVERALQRLEALNKRQGRIVVLRMFAGMTVEETAEALGICKTTVKTDWVLATAFLRRELNSYCDASPMGAS